VSLYTKTAVSGGDSWGRRNRSCAGLRRSRRQLWGSVRWGWRWPGAQLEGGASCLRRGDRVRPWREQPYRELSTLTGKRGREGDWV